MNLKDIKDKNKNKQIREYDVFVPNQASMFPSCSCHHFISYLLPYCHIARVYVNIQDRKYEVRNTVHPYCHISNHPLYKEVQNTMNNSINLCESDSIGLSLDECNGTTDMQKSETTNNKTEDLNCLLAKIKFPKTQSRRYAELNGMAQQLIDCAKLDRTIFKLTKIQLNQMIQNAKLMLQNNKRVKPTNNDSKECKIHQSTFVPLHLLMRIKCRSSENLKNYANYLN